MNQVVIIGGGISGLVFSYLLQQSGLPLQVTVVEKNTYPHHKVCGEYISNEVKPFLKSIGLYPENIVPSEINKFILSAVNGHFAHTPLDMGGFGISRFAFDNFLYQKAKDAGVHIIQNTQVKSVDKKGESFLVSLSSQENLLADLVIGAQGKRSTIDKKLERDFMSKRSGYIGVKYHVKTDFPDDTIALHNFEGGYCGISKVEGDTYNLCYLGNRADLRKYGDVHEMEEQVLFKNPFLKNIFKNSEFLFESPLVINEFSFRKKTTHESGVVMIGDAAGLITPLCGNGMALAIHSAKLLSDIVIDAFQMKNANWLDIANKYNVAWKKHFAFRLQSGRIIQNLFGSHYASNLAVGLMKKSKWITNTIIKNTHGAYLPTS